VKSHTTASFRRNFANLPERIKKQARNAYRLFQANPAHPSLRFKLVHPTKPVYSARVGRNYRAVGVLSGGEIVWFWIGSHKEYEQVIAEPPQRGQ